MTLKFSNNAETTLSVGIAAVDTTFAVPAGDSALFDPLGAGLTQRVTITDGTNYEVVEITSWAGDTATCTRGVEGVNQLWAAGAVVSARVTAGTLDALQQKADAAAQPLDSVALATSLDILTTDTAIDLSVLAPNAVPRVISKIVGGVNATVTLPPTTTGNAYVIDFVKNDSRVDFVVQTGESFGGVVDGTDFMAASNGASLVGANGAWVINFSA